MVPNTVSYMKGKNVDYYLNQAGGYSDNARKSKKFIVYMNGQVTKVKGSGKKQIEPGCEIIVPSKAKKKGNIANILGYATSFSSLGMMIASIANLIKKYVEEYEPQGVNRLIKDIQEFSHTIIYMPTFRDDQSDFMLASGINLDLLNDFLEKRDELFLFKLHPATVVSNVSSIFSNIRFLDKDVDVYPILPFTDLLITDYSSIFYDYLLLDKGIVLFPFDYEKYICQCRDLAFDFDDYTPGVRAYSFDSLMEILSDWNYGNSLTTEQNRIKKIFWGDIPMQNSCKVLTRYIINNGSSNNVDL